VAKHGERLVTVRLLLVDDHELLRAGLASVLGTDPELEVVGQCDDGRTATTLTADLAPDVVLMDVEMPGGDGITATRAIRTRHPGTAVLVLTTFDLDEYVLEALRAGASGFLIKTTPPRELMAAIKACAAGETALGPTVLQRLVETYVQRRAGSPFDEALGRLTSREVDVLRAVARGLSNLEIGAQLFLAETTVKTHVTRILAKLGVRDRVQAVVIAHDAGLMR
jgi:DNA-binding NarL/FixJ family response regulator